MTEFDEPGSSRRFDIVLERVGFSWPGGKFALDVADFRVGRGEKLLLLGESGTGKSTLLSLICGITVPRSGRIEVAGHPMSALGGAGRDRVRADNIGVIFQMFNLLPYASGMDNILVPLRFSRARRARCADPRADSLALTRALGLEDDLVIGASAASLSVGQQQRVAAARALIGRPGVIVADEPTSALDENAQGEFLDLLFGQVAQTGSTLVMVSHNPRLADRFDRVVPLRDIAETRRTQAA